MFRTAILDVLQWDVEQRSIPAIIGLVLSGIGIWLSFRARRPLPDIQAQWHKPGADRPGSGLYNRIIVIRQGDDGPNWQILTVSIKGHKGAWLSKRFEPQSDENGFAGYSDPQWESTLTYPIPVPTDRGQVILLNPDFTHDSFKIRLTLKPSGGCWIPYRKTYPCWPNQRRWGSV